jgi:hypothetical protein
MKGYCLLSDHCLMDHTVRKSSTNGQRIMNLESQPGDKLAVAQTVFAPELRFSSKGLNVWSPSSTAPSM